MFYGKKLSLQIQSYVNEDLSGIKEVYPALTALSEGLFLEVHTFVRIQ